MVVGGVEEGGKDNLVLAALMVLEVVGLVGTVFVEEGDVPVEGGREQGVVVLEGLNGPNFLLVDLDCVDELEGGTEEGNSAVLVRDYYVLGLSSPPRTLLAM